MNLKYLEIVLLVSIIFFGNTHFAASADDREDDTIKELAWNTILNVN